jgi:polyhydroxyalkanoate synthesis repressor PhaR
MNRSVSPRVVKKYSNRRLYDTAESRYVTLEELAESIRRGADVRVVDAQTGEDLTQATLVQIIIEGRGAAQFLSVPILTQLIRMSDDALAEFFGRWVSAALELYQHARQGVAAIAPYNPLAAVPFAASNVIARMLQVLPGPWIQPTQYPTYVHPAPPPSATPEVPPPDEHPGVTASTPSNADVESLRRELDDLKRVILASRDTAPRRRKSDGTQRKTR